MDTILHLPPANTLAIVCIFFVMWLVIMPDHICHAIPPRYCVEGENKPPVALTPMLLMLR